MDNIVNKYTHTQQSLWEVQSKQRKKNQGDEQKRKEEQKKRASKSQALKSLNNPEGVEDPIELNETELKELVNQLNHQPTFDKAKLIFVLERESIFLKDKKGKMIKQYSITEAERLLRSPRKDENTKSASGNLINIAF